ncbi:uncharacterized protein LOC130629736 [Hydractinia symbiolongicarpus]|uniref:uncharacterized protein LOC130629736 n=1 Tax=Hydractinia symbiolongicarpus TaxID=13093 RepID=UPI00255114C4|nr:uncharacterized protein LOC130629736 [Hydractinia symbiolongicarpus]XP_057299058.1 uncharacterized protein LOC130629736 [Hydractinia symbiolongicarpus]
MIMDKDKELLLSLGKDSDSDDVVEEFKLPPPRSRRSKRKTDNRIVSSSSPFITFKCIFTFVTISIFISGVLLLAFTVLTMQSTMKQLESKIKNLETDLSKKIDADKISSLSNKNDGLVKNLKSAELKYTIVTNQLATVNQSLQKLQKSVVEKSIKHIEPLEKDMDLLKTGMAKTGSSIEGIKESVKELRKDFNRQIDDVQTYVHNYTAQLRSLAIEAAEDNEDKTSQSTVTKKYVDFVVANVELNAKNKREQMLKTVDWSLSNLKSITDSFNQTHVADLLRLTKIVSSMKNRSETFQDMFQDKYLPEVMQLKNQSIYLEKKIDDHRIQLVYHSDQLQNMSAEVQSIKKKLSFVPQSTPRSTTAVASDTKELSTEKSLTIATNQPGTTGVPVETKSIEATVAPVTVDGKEETPRPSTSNFPAVTATTPAGSEELADNITTTEHSVSWNQTEIKTPDETTEIVNATEQPHLNQTEKISSTAQPALGPVLPNESGIPKGAVVPREEIDAQTEIIQPTPLATVQPIKESNDSMSTPTNENTTSTSQTTVGGTAQPDRDSVSNLQGPVFEQKAKKESEGDYPSFGSNDGPISPGNQGGLNPGDQGGLNPEDQGRLNPENQGGRNSKDQDGLNPGDQGGLNPIDQGGLNPIDQDGPNPEDQHGPNPEDQHGPNPEDQRELNPEEEGDNVPINQGGITPNNQNNPKDQDRLNPGFNQPTKRSDHSSEDYENDLDHL